MFNLSFGELLVIGVIGIIVLGPARLPQTARFIGHLIGRVQRQVSLVKADIKREIALEDMKSIHREYEETARHMRDNFGKATAEVEKEMRAIKDDAEDAGDKTAAGNIGAGDKSGGDGAPAGDSKAA